VIVDQLEQLWTALLQFSETFITPDWGELVGLLPVFLIVGVVGPILTLLVFAWFVYVVRRPRSKAVFAEVRRPAPRDAEGNPVFPPGEPYSLSEGMLYEPGATRSDRGEDLLVACPQCGLVRDARSDTCGNCGLSFTLKPTTRSSLRPAGPPPGGAAAA
jgi:hypothetical protein